MSSSEDTPDLPDTKRKSIEETVAALRRQMPADPDTDDCGHCGGELTETDRGVTCRDCKAQSFGPHWVWSVPVSIATRKAREEDALLQAYECAVCGVRMEGLDVTVTANLRDTHCTPDD